MAITITCLDDSNHTISSSKKILSRQGELGETITFSLPSTLNAAYPRAWIMVQQPDGQLYYIDNGSAAGFTWPNPYTFTYNIGDRDTMLSSDGTLGIQLVLRDATPPAQTVEWRSRILYLTIEGSILSNTDSGGSLIDSLSSGTLDKIADIQYDSLADGDLLYRDTTTGKWRNVTLVDGTNISHSFDKTAGELTFNATGTVSSAAEDVSLADVSGKFTAINAEEAFEELYDETVKNTGNETVAGIKTFSSSPVVPTLAATDDSTKAVNSAFTHDAIANDLNASGSAPMYACRAWVEFNGTGTVAIRADGNIDSIVDNNVGDYTINIDVDIEDAKYSIVGAGSVKSGTDYSGFVCVDWNTSAPSVGSFDINYVDSGGTNRDNTYLNIAIFR